MKTSLWTALLALALSACASTPAELEAAKMEREKIANGFELTADGWQRLGVNVAQQAHYRKLAEETRKAPPPRPARADSPLNRLFKALLAPPAGSGAN